jgi:hypothetical protein
MRQIGNDQYTESEAEEISREQSVAFTSPAEQSSPARSMPVPPYSALVRASSEPTLLAVVDASGYLMPVCTAGDLLRVFRSIWHASQD